MAASGGKVGDFYAVLGLNKECSEAELRNAYKKLALRWHPDRCSASVESEFVEKAKEKFQAIQEAYSILSDSNKRLLYDVGVYDSDDDENGMGDFLDEMAQLMRQTKPNEKGQESFEDLQQLFVEMFEGDLNLNGLGRVTAAVAKTKTAASSGSKLSCNAGSGSSGGCGGKRSRSTLSSDVGKTKLQELDAGSSGFCYGSNERRQYSGSSGSRRDGRKRKTSSKHDISSKDAEISA